MPVSAGLTKYASVGRTHNARESAQWGSAGHTEAIELGNRLRLEIGAQRGAIFGVVNTMEGA